MARLWYWSEKGEFGPERFEMLDTRTGDAVMSKLLRSLDAVRAFDNGNRFAIRGK